MLQYLPKFFSNRAIIFYFVVLAGVSLFFISNSISFIWIAFGVVEVVGFFYFSNKLTRQWSSISSKTFVNRIFNTALTIRIIWVIFSYIFFLSMTGEPFEFNVADAKMYHDVGTEFSVRGFAHLDSIFWGMGFSDRGYPFYLGIIYSIFGNAIIIPRILKAFYSAYTCVLIYKLSNRNFGENVGRMSAIFCMLMPNLIYYTGLHVKETEMLFLIVWFIERSDFLLRSKNYNFINISAPLVLATSLFFFRTVLGATAFFSLFTALMFSSNRILGFGKRTILIIWMFVAASYFIGGRISNEIEQAWSSRSTNQVNSMQFRSKRLGGNEYAKYFSGAIFAPLIFVIPLPTIVEIPGQEGLKLLNGGYFSKNIMAFFTIFALFWLIKNNKWRDHLLIESFTLGYLIIISMSAFAQSERFHIPSLPFELIFSALGISLITNKEKRFFNLYIILLIFAIAGWSWFKLAGRGIK